MSNAVCTKCGKEYSWHARRGARLADFLSPCCNAPGRAVSHLTQQPRKRIYCPECHRAGLRTTDGMGNRGHHVIHDGQTIWEGWITGHAWCTRCKKWVKPVFREVKI